MSVPKFACVLYDHYKYIEPFNATFCGVTRSTIDWMKKDSSIFDMMNSQEMKMYKEINNVPVS